MLLRAKNDIVKTIVCATIKERVYDSINLKSSTVNCSTDIEKDGTFKIDDIKI